MDLIEDSICRLFADAPQSSPAVWFIWEMRQQRLKFVLVLMVVVVIGWPVCDGTAEAEAQISDQTDVDRPGKRKTFFYFLLFSFFNWIGK